MSYPHAPCIDGVNLATTVPVHRFTDTRGQGTPGRRTSLPSEARLSRVPAPVQS